SDSDFTDFGPFYGGSDSDIDACIQSLVSLIDLEADYFITSHEAGILTLEELTGAVPEYLDKVDERDGIVTERLQKGMSVDEIAREGVCYPKRALKDPFVFMWEKVQVKKHARRLVSTGAVQLEMESASQILKDSEPLLIAQYGFDLSVESTGEDPTETTPVDFM
ncbi:MAG: hypothetical protein JW738_05705, partial [Actinobacteria bacterium]|nr:hypothetical protein [Actinomycetota bacterium]